MAIGHIAIRCHGRRAGHTAAAALAYRHGTRLRAPSGQVHDYRHRARAEHIIEEGLTAPKRWTGGDDLQLLADKIEAGEKRSDACLLRDVQVALPHELSEKEQVALARDFADILRKRYDTPIAWAVHRPDPDCKKPRGGEPGDRRNVHAHLVLPSRNLNKGGDAFHAKLSVLDNRVSGRTEVAALRNAWADCANAALKAAKIDARVDVGRAQAKSGEVERYSQPLPHTKSGLVEHGRALLKDLDLLLRDAPSQMVVRIQMTIKQYFALVYQQTTLPAWARANANPLKTSSSNCRGAVSDLISNVLQRTRKASKPVTHMTVSPRKIEIGAGEYVWGAAIQNPNASLARGDALELTTRAGNLRATTVQSIEVRHNNFALVRTAPHATVLLRAKMPTGELVEIRREVDWTVTASKAGRPRPIGQVLDGQITLAATPPAREIADKVGQTTLPEHDFAQRFGAALAEQGAIIIHPASKKLPTRSMEPSDRPVTPAAVTPSLTETVGGLAAIFPTTVTSAKGAPAKFDAAKSLRDTFRQNQEEYPAVVDAPWTSEEVHSEEDQADDQVGSAAPGM